MKKWDSYIKYVHNWTRKAHFLEVGDSPMSWEEYSEKYDANASDYKAEAKKDWLELKSKMENLKMFQIENVEEFYNAIVSNFNARRQISTKHYIIDFRSVRVDVIFIDNPDRKTKVVLSPIVDYFGWGVFTFDMEE